MKLGIVGLPNVGKSTLFNAITSTKNAEAANYPFCTIEPNSGIVAVPDKRLDKLAEIWQTNKKTPAIVEFVDIAGLVKGASQGAGLGNKHAVTVPQAMYGLCARKLQGKVTFQAGEQERKGGQGHGLRHYGSGLQNSLRIRHHHAWRGGKGGKCPWQGVGLAEQGKTAMFGEFAERADRYGVRHAQFSCSRWRELSCEA